MAQARQLPLPYRSPRFAAGITWRALAPESASTRILRCTGEGSTGGLWSKVIVRFLPCAILGAWVIDPAPHTDERGRFFRAWCSDEFAAHGIHFAPLQANMGSSRRVGTVRGLHYQERPHEEAKAVRCTRGSVFDVIVDLRPDSPTAGSWFGVELSADNGRMVYVPPLCAHGYQTLAEDSEVFYMTSAIYAPDAVRGLRFDDPAIGVRWPLPVQAVSEQDRGWPLLNADRVTL